MDESVILEFDKKESCGKCLAAIDQVAAYHFASLGYTVKLTNHGTIVIGKNSLTGEDNPEGVTNTWDVIKESPDKTWYIVSPSQDKRYQDWKKFMPEGLDLGTEKEFPKEWITEETE